MTKKYISCMKSLMKSIMIEYHLFHMIIMLENKEGVCIKLEI